MDAFDPQRRYVTAEGVLFTLCTVSLAVYLCFSVAVRAFFSELVRLGGKFLG